MNDNRTPAPGPPFITGRKTHLRPVMPVDLDAMRIAELSGPDAALYRHRGATPPPEEYATTLSRGVVAQFMICERATGRPVGHVASYEHNFRNGTCYVAAMVFPEDRRRGWPMEGAELFLDYLFENFPLRKVYAEMHAVNLEQFASVVRGPWHEEGRLVADEFVRGEFVDKVILALTRDAWRSRGATEGGLLAALRGTASGHGEGGR
jgi:RimJ/RimL family protein N-acetyltransferase